MDRVLSQVEDLPARIAQLKEAGLRFRNEMRSARAASKFKLKIRTATRSSSSSRFDRLLGMELQPRG
jgi:hypothetical protein